MSDNRRIERLIREARVQRSAEIGMALGEFLGNSWLAAAAMTRKALTSLRGPKARAVQSGKAIGAR
jgi:hypothetical protein